jgi:hypothetical protein
VVPREGAEEGGHTVCVWGNLSVNWGLRVGDPL